MNNVATKRELRTQIAHLKAKVEKLESQRDKARTERNKALADLVKCEEGEPEPPKPETSTFFAHNSPWNSPITSSALMKRVDFLVSHGSGKIDPIYVPFNSSDWSHPIYWAKSSDPLYEVQVQNPTWGGFNQNGKKIHIPIGAKPASGGDAHLTIVQPASGDFAGQIFGFYSVSSIGNGRVTASSAGYSDLKIGSGTDRGNTTAAGFNNAAGILTADELEANNVPHALFIITNCTCGNALSPAQPGTTAVRCGSSRFPNPSCPCDMPPLGTRLRLNPSYDISWAPPGQKAILEALQVYGGYIGDTGFYSRSKIFGTLAEGVESGGAKLRQFCERAKSEGWASGSGDYSLDFGKDVDWSQLRAIIN